MGPRPDNSTEAGVEQANAEVAKVQAPVCEKDVADVAPAQAAEAPAAPAVTTGADQRQQIPWASLGRWALKHSAIAMSPVVFLYFPCWVSTKFLRLDESFTAAEFLDQCSRGDKSLEDPHYPILRFFYMLPMFFGFLPVYWLLPHTGMPEVAAEQDPAVYKEGCARAGKLRSRQIIGAIFVFFWVAGFFVFLSNTLSAGLIYLVNTLLMAAGMIWFAIGTAVTGAKLGAPWARGCCRTALSAVLFVLYLLVAQVFTIYTSTVLNRHKNNGYLMLMLIANGVIALSKQVCMRADGDLGILSVMILGTGGAVSFFLSLYVFVKPTMAEAISTALMGAAVGLGGHLMNYIFFKHTKVHPRAALTLSVVMYSNEIYKTFAQLASLLVLLSADTRYFAVAQYGFGEQVNVGLVLFNFCFSLVCQLVVACLGIKLSHLADKDVNLEKFASSYKGFHSMLSMAALLCATVYFSVASRVACLVCPTGSSPMNFANTCFD